ncbi:catalase family peroxidase [Pseudoxanthomonas putridarboris]|uniref:Catalase-related peroxidase n=1 Tax=Pseudoxanthomonas putridarboris TaxID=752605 RepID=A0ABU9J277_9GAMM
MNASDPRPAPTPADPPPAPPAPHRPRPWLALAGIGAIACTAAAAFAWTAGWLGGDRLTAQGMTNAIEATGADHPGFRRAHAKGVCVSGTFQASAQAEALSSAPTFSGAALPVLGRLSIGGGDPHGADNSARVRSLALRIGDNDGPQWRMAMNSFPFLAVATPEAFQQQSLAARPDPATGKPDPAAMDAFLATHPRAQAFQQWAKQAPWSDSWANTHYNSVNAFRFTDAHGTTRLVRWTMRPQTPFHAMDSAQRQRADADFLAEDLRARLAQGPLRWDMVVTVAGPGDAVDDPSLPWPESREQVVVGTLTLAQAEPQATGACRDVNFDPLILPPGVAASDDPILAARSAVYSQSFNRRQREIALRRADDATGKEQAP